MLRAALPSCAGANGLRFLAGMRFALCRRPRSRGAGIAGGTARGRCSQRDPRGTLAAEQPPGRWVDLGGSRLGPDSGEGAGKRFAPRGGPNQMFGAAGFSSRRCWMEQSKARIGSRSCARGVWLGPRAGAGKLRGAPCGSGAERPLASAARSAAFPFPWLRSAQQSEAAHAGGGCDAA